MTHHQGMSLLSIANFLKGGMVQNWFHRDARVQATELLLQERPVGHVPAPPKNIRRSKATGRNGAGHSARVERTFRPASKL
jgi:cyclic beta-1,2-glucan synthetase